MPCGCGHEDSCGESPRLGGVQHPGVLDAFAHDTRSGRLLMAMYETRPWTGGDGQLFELQEKLNAYLSFALDGELAETFPELAGKPITIQLRTQAEPSLEAWELIRRVREQLDLQGIAFEVAAMDEALTHTP